MSAQHIKRIQEQLSTNETLLWWGRPRRLAYLPELCFILLTGLILSSLGGYLVYIALQEPIIRKSAVTLFSIITLIPLILTCYGVWYIWCWQHTLYALTEYRAFVIRRNSVQKYPIFPGCVKHYSGKDIVFATKRWDSPRFTYTENLGFLKLTSDNAARVLNLLQQNLNGKALQKQKQPHNHTQYK